MFTKTQALIMQVFASKIIEKFSINQISKIIKKPYPLVHRSIRVLIDKGFIIKDSKGFLELNYKENHQELTYIESLRKKDILSKDKLVSLFEKIVNNIASNFTVKFDINIISVESAYEMLSKRDKINILNESLNKHIILFGTENFYRILKNAR